MADGEGTGSLYGTAGDQGQPWQVETAFASVASSKGKESGLNQPCLVVRWLDDHREEHRERATDHFALGQSRPFRSSSRLGWLLLWLGDFIAGGLHVLL